MSDMKTKHIVTGLGKLFWVQISGEGSVNPFKDSKDPARFEYKAEIHLSGQEAKKVIDSIVEVARDSGIEGSEFNVPYKVVTEEDGKMKTVNIRESARVKNSRNIVTIDEAEYKEGVTYAFLFRTRANFENSQGISEPVKIPHRDEQNRDFLETKKIGNESIGRLSGKLQAYSKLSTTGIALYLTGVQTPTKTLNEYGSVEFPVETEGDDVFSGDSGNTTEVDAASLEATS